MIKFIVGYLIISVTFFAQLDTIKYQWPVAPVNSNQGLTATFCEFRDTESSDHFHNAVDIGHPDGNPVYNALDGVVHDIYNTGSNSYVSVRSLIDGKWKRITYLHILPNPAMYVGKNVTKGTILGTIYTGMGHVHLIERELVTGINDYAVEINNVRENGGLFPYSDSYPPEIYLNTIIFRVNGTNQELPAYGLASKVDIILRVEENNGIGSSYSNNGTYLLGYRIWDSLKTEVVYEAVPEGIMYRFDTKPSNSYVHKVFVDELATLSDPVYFLTNGDGAEYINQTGVVNDNFLDTELLEEGKYQLEIFTEDTRGNTDNAFKEIIITRNDIVAPGTPILKSLKNHNNKKGVKVSWVNNNEPDIKGYRLYYSTNAVLNDWILAADETILTKEINEYSFESPDEFINKPAFDIYFFAITAIDSSGNESKFSDVYSRSSYFEGNSFPKALIVDGFDRYGGLASWQSEVHSFNLSYFIPITISDSVVISSCANEAVIDNSILLEDYDMVFWFLGDESTIDETFDATEQLRLSQYLENGGNLFVSGSEIGWDLDREHSGTWQTDTLFYRHYLKASLIYDGNFNMTSVKGVSGGLFDNIQFPIGTAYQEDYPDDVDPNNGSFAVMEYQYNRANNVPMKSGVAYSGNFGSSSNLGKIVYFSFALESVSNQSSVIKVINKVLEFFDQSTFVEELNFEKITDYKLYNNFPNPFNPSTLIAFQLPETAIVTLEIFNILGEQIEILTNGEFGKGIYEVEWNASKYAGGVYFAKFKAGNYTNTLKLLLLK